MVQISTHAPHTGRDQQVADRLFASQISTHAPHTGRDHKGTV